MKKQRIIFTETQTMQPKSTSIWMNKKREYSITLRKTYLRRHAVRLFLSLETGTLFWPFQLHFSSGFSPSLYLVVVAMLLLWCCLRGFKKTLHGNHDGLERSGRWYAKIDVKRGEKIWNIDMHLTRKNVARWRAISPKCGKSFWFLPRV